MGILKEQQLQEYVIEALKGSGMPVEDGYSDKIVRKYIKKVVIYEEYVLVDIFSFCRNDREKILTFMLICYKIISIKV